MNIQEYTEQLQRRYKTGISREHSYRGDLQTLLESLLDHILVTNEPQRSDVGAPDYILTKGKIPVGYIEAKDIGDSDLAGKKKNKEQFNRYKDGLPNLIFTDYLDFHLYRDGEFVSSVRIADIEDGKIVAKPEKFAEFENLIKEFGTHVGQTIRSSSKLSKMMAGKARLLATIIENALNADKEQDDRVNESANNTLREQLSAFQNVLIHDINPKEFADIYAQTIAYGMFAARLHDPTLETFSRQEAAELIPKTNPFLRKLFHYIAGYDLDDRIAWVVDGLADIFRATDVDGLLKNFGKATQQQDPIIHFYETFLAEYDPKLRKSRGVWYTPEPVVNFIVRAVDDILKDEFGLKDGLADTAKTTVKVNTDVKDKRSPTGYKQEEREVHKVQILDPAAGTGTFLAEVIKQIHKKFEGQQGIWEKYVEEHLIPRLNGFEILMASYAMAHLKLDLLLRETGVEPSGSQRFRVYLTNSLEEHHPDTGTLFANWLSEEANEANHIKRDTPVMVVLGNPPYSGISSNMGEWISELIEDYKYVDGEHFGERKHWLHDDYVKFIRYGQHFVEKNGEGVLAYINNHSFIDNPTFRGMRWHLLKAFDEIYILDLNGSSKKKRNFKNKLSDENVFDIQQGVSINLFIKKNSTKKSTNKNLAEIFHFDLFGLRQNKYDFLNNKSIKEIDFNDVISEKPYFFFVPKDTTGKEDYNFGFHLNELFKDNSVGFVTANDTLNISFTKIEHERKLNDLLELEENKWREKYNRKSDSRDWQYENAKNDTKENFSRKNLTEISYRPFDNRITLYTGNSRGLYASPQPKTSKHFVRYSNIGLSICKQFKTGDTYKHVFITNKIMESSFVSNKTSEITSLFPLYLYPEKSTQQTLVGQPERTPNLDKKIVQEIAKKLGLKFVPEKEDAFASGAKQSRESGQDQRDRHVERQQSPSAGNDASREDEVFAPIDLLDYIYAVLHSPSYREKYKEFLKIDFPRVPYPEDPKQFWQLVELGGELRQIHLLEHPVVEDFITTYPESGSNVISNRLTKNDPGFVPDEHTDFASGAKQSRESGQDQGDRRVERQQSPSAGNDTPRESGQVLGKVWINDEQYFGNVPKKAWEFYIGGYQPAEKWLKDRRDRELTFEEIQHYQKIIVALMETDRIMREIDGVWGE